LFAFRESNQQQNKGTAFVYMKWRDVAIFELVLSHIRRIRNLHGAILGRKFIFIRTKEAQSGE
jgi:hypothetical protein